ncbi:MAG: DUF4124 domain-containing protein [bacterium]
MHKFLVMFIGLGVAVGIAPVAAETYRWVDDEGNTVYSQSPPPDDREVKSIKPPPPPPPGETERMQQRLETLQEASDTRNKAAAKAAETERKEQDAAMALKKDCENSRKSLDILQSRPPHSTFAQPDGTYKRYNAEEWHNRINELNKFLDENCRR